MALPHRRRRVNHPGLVNKYSYQCVVSLTKNQFFSGYLAHFFAGDMIEDADGGIIGVPVWKQESTWLYLSGHSASHVADCFRGGPIGVEIIGDEIGKASALKMCFAANTKGTTALLCAIVATAEKMGVRKELEKQWSRDGSDFAQKTLVRVRNVAAKAWRFSGEMEEIASTLEEAGLPGGFHLAASDIFQRIARFKDSSPALPVEDVLDALLGPDQSKDF